MTEPCIVGREHLIDGVLVRVVPHAPDYAVSLDGRVARLTSKMKREWQPRWLNPGVKQDGHKYVSLYSGRSNKIERLIEAAWNPSTFTAREYHGHAKKGLKSRTYVAWNNMKQRCYDPKSQRFNCYGARGIRVIDRWHIFANFLADMGECPENLTLERLDPDGNYEPSNCCWADAITQANNKRPRHRNIERPAA